MPLWTAATTVPTSQMEGHPICRALLHEPPLIFLDEPTSGLDPEAALMVREFIESLKDEGRTIFLTTHNLNEAERLCDRVAVFKSRLLIVDTVENLRKATFGTQVDITMLNASDDHVRLIEGLDQGLEVVRRGNVVRVRVDWRVAAAQPEKAWATASSSILFTTLFAV